jgi:hypothetical protein
MTGIAFVWIGATIALGEGARKCRSCKKRQCAPPVRLIKLTATAYPRVHSDEQR